MPHSRKEVAKAILDLSYVEMMELADQLSLSIKQDREDGEEVNCENSVYLSDRLRWWAEGFLDSIKEDEE